MEGPLLLGRSCSMLLGCTYNKTAFKTLSFSVVLCSATPSAKSRAVNYFFAIHIRVYEYIIEKLLEEVMRVRYSPRKHDVRLV